MNLRDVKGVNYQLSPSNPMNSIEINLISNKRFDNFIDKANAFTVVDGYQYFYYKYQIKINASNTICLN